ncbi:MAG: hypothetical protein ACLPUO_04850 [Streptosporangiaceae bacterium]
MAQHRDTDRPGRSGRRLPAAAARADEVTASQDDLRDGWVPPSRP